MARDMIVRWIIEYVPTPDQPRRCRVVEFYKSGLVKSHNFQYRFQAKQFLEKRQKGVRVPWDRPEINVPGTNSEVFSQ